MSATIAAKLVDNENAQQAAMANAKSVRNRLINAAAFDSEKGLSSNIDLGVLLGYVNSLSDLSNDMTRLLKERDALAG